MINNIRKNLDTNKNPTKIFLIVFLILSLSQILFNYYFQKKFFINNKIFINYKIAENNFIKNPTQSTYKALVESLNLKYHFNHKDKHDIQINTVKIENLKDFTKYIEDKISWNSEENQKTLNEAYCNHIENICKNIHSKN